MQVRDRRQISLLILSEFERINSLLFPVKSSKNLCFLDDFKGNRSYLFNQIRLILKAKFGDSPYVNFNLYSYSNFLLVCFLHFYDYFFGKKLVRVKRLLFFSCSFLQIFTLVN